ncbi:exodeoxyribonuclease VII small subunit [PVC group bacterium]|nr:exodeoxyribonuclease VII small subunit [PVC group bacterium]
MPKSKEKKKNFESALSCLEEIVQCLEDESLNLDDSIKKFEEGISLVRFCSKKLDESEKRIEILLKDKDGKIRLEKFDVNDE